MGALYKASRFASGIAAAIVAAAAPTSQAANPPAWINVGPPGGKLQGVIADPADASHVYAVDVQGFVQESHDRGASWRPAAARACPSGEGEMRGGVIYLQCGNRVLSSDDGGASWAPFMVGSAGSSLDVARVALDPAGSGRAVITTYSAVLRTSDAGKTWNADSTAPLVSSPAVAFDPSAPNRVFGVSHVLATGNMTVWTSLDGGATWAARGVTNACPPLSSCLPFALAIDGGGTLYYGDSFGMHVSRDGGATWALGNVSAASAIRLRVDPSRSGHVFGFNGFNNQVVETGDAGATWSAESLAQGNITSLALAADGTAWAVAGGVLVRREAAGGAWSAVTTLAIRAAGAAYGIAGIDDVLFAAGMRSPDGGLHWSGGIPGGLIPVAGQRDQYYALFLRTDQGPQGISLSVDRGATWTDSGISLPVKFPDEIAYFTPAGPQPGKVYAANVIVSCDTGSPTCSIFARAILRSGDGGATWTALANAPSGYGVRLVASPADAHVVYLSLASGLYRSGDDGDHWALVRPGTVDEVVADAADASSVYVRAGASVFVSTDAGSTWRTASPANVRSASATLLADPVTGGRLYLVAPGGASFDSLDRGASWRQVALGDPSITGAPVAAIAVQGAQRRILRGADDTVYALDVPDSPLVPDTDLWWNPAEPGWGVSIAEHADGEIFAVWYHYDAQGKATWSVMPGGTWTDATVFQGTLYQSHAAPFFAGPFDPATVRLTAIGTLQLRFADANSATLAVTFNDGSAGYERAIVRQLYGRPASAIPLDVAGLWWNRNQSGWGIAMNQQYANVFATWFVYDALGNPTWLVAPDMTLAGTSTSAQSGALYAATGPSFSAPYDPAKVAVTKVGTLTWIPGGSSDWLRFSAYGASRDIPVSRQPF